MAVFLAFSDILPDPAHPITDSGEMSLSGTPGPGFSALNFRSVTDTQSSRTISGRGVQRDGGSQHWEFDISYNPMFRYQFDPVDSFLLARNPRRDPFYVVLPQHSRPKDPAFATLVATTPPTVAGVHLAGSPTLMITNASGSIAYPKPGDAFTINDPLDYNHQKVYKVARIETPVIYQAGTIAPGALQLRIHISPPLQRTTSSTSVLSFLEPKFRVITKSDVQEYQLNTDNLYSFGLNCEEIQP